MRKILPDVMIHWCRSYLTSIVTKNYFPIKEKATTEHYNSRQHELSRQNRLHLEPHVVISAVLRLVNETQWWQTAHARARRAGVVLVVNRSSSPTGWASNLNGKARSLSPVFNGRRHGYSTSSILRRTSMEECFEFWELKFPLGGRVPPMKESNG